MENRTFLYRVASQYALSYAVYIIGLFFLMNQAYSQPLSTFSMTLFMTMVLLTPLLLFRYVRTYRNRFTGGIISFTHAWSFTLVLHFFAGLLVAFFLYLYTRYFNREYASWIIAQAIKSLEEYQRLATSASQTSILSVDRSLELLKEAPAPSPITLAIQSFWTLINSGCFVGIVIAFFAKQKTPRNFIKPSADQPQQPQEPYRA